MMTSRARAPRSSNGGGLGHGGIAALAVGGEGALLVKEAPARRQRVFVARHALAMMKGARDGLRITR